MSAADTLRERLEGRAPKLALVLGSGLSGVADAVEDAVRVPYADLEGFPSGDGVSGHGREVVAGRIGKTDVAVLTGRVHYYEHGRADAMRPALEALAEVGVERLILTNSAGSVDPAMRPGDVMLIEDHINFSGTNPLIGEPTDRRFVGLTSTYDADMREGLARAAMSEGVTLRHGVYMWFSGPSFETPAEIRMAATLGADAVGMSTVPEAILARFLGLRVTALSVITNMAAGMTGAELSHDETKEMAPVGGARLAKVLTRYLEDA